MLSNLSENTIIWAKTVGYPWWPGYIKSLTPNGFYEIEYFGDFTRNWHKRPKIRKFDEIQTKSNIKNYKLFQAIQSAKRIFDGNSTIQQETINFCEQNIQNSLKSNLEKNQILTDFRENKAKSFPEFEQETGHHLTLLSTSHNNSIEQQNPSFETTKNKNSFENIFQSENILKSTIIEKNQLIPFKTDDAQNYENQLISSPFLSKRKINRQKLHFSENLSSKKRSQRLSLGDVPCEYKEIKHLEKKLSKIFLKIKKEDIQSSLINEQLNDWICNFIQESKQTPKIHLKKIKSLLTKIRKRLLDLSISNIDFDHICKSVSFIVEKIKSAENMESFKNLYFSRNASIDNDVLSYQFEVESEHQIDCQDIENNDPESDYECRSQKSKKIIKKKNLKKVSTHKSIELSLEVRNRVCKKLSKEFYRLTFERIFTKQEIENFFIETEQLIRNKFEEDGVYKAKICQVVQDLPRICEKMRSMFEQNEEYTYAQVQGFFTY